MIHRLHLRVIPDHSANIDPIAPLQGRGGRSYLIGPSLFERHVRQDHRHPRISTPRTRTTRQAKNQADTKRKYVFHPTSLANRRTLATLARPT